MDFMDYSGGQLGSHDGAEDYVVANGAPSAQHYSSYTDPSKQQPYMNGYNGAAISCDIKPRLTKEQHDILEAHFQKQNKPNTNTKKGFAETLNVSLDKVNNWFQNRRAKLKQDAKKQQGSLNLYHGNQHASSDSETSPAFVDTSSQYHAMMGHWTTEQRVSNGLGISHPQAGHGQISPDALALHGMAAAHTPFGAYNGAVQFNGDMFSSQEEFNRRTLTQEQFDAMGRNGGMATGYGMYEDVATTFNGDQAAMHAVFPGGYGELKQQQAVDNYPIGAPMTSYDSTIPSNISAESLPIFPSSTQMQPYANLSANTSEWSDSRSSSVHEGTVTQQHQPTATSQWQPGQSVPVDATQQQEEFRQVAARAGHARPSPQHSWSEDALARRGSSASLVQSMGDVGIQTPPQPAGTFKSPLPPANIAARRQRPRPAALGVAALRSQSHTGLVPQPSPNHVQTPQFNPPDQPLRRIRSSNYLGNMAHGRVMKSTPGSAQRSPLNFSFAEAMNSPLAMRHASASLAPPTPLSPKESTEMSEGQMQQWQAMYGARHASITETEAEHAQSYQAVAGLPTHTWTSSPPVTPMYHQHHFVQSRVNGHPMMENTPPQSAPASQTCFSNVFAVPQPPRPAPPQQVKVPSQAVPSQPLASQQTAAVVSTPVTQQPQMVSSDAKYQVPNYAFASPQEMSDMLQFAHGVPIADANGNIDFIFPSAPPVSSQPQHHFVPQSVLSHQATPPQQHQHMHTPPQVTYPFVSSSTGSSPSSQINGKSSSDFFVHEYSPPDSVKRTATPRKGPADSVPRNYAFANTGPEHFEEKKGKKSDSSNHSSTSSSTSPASSSGTALTSTF